MPQNSLQNERDAVEKLLKLKEVRAREAELEKPPIENMAVRGVNRVADTAYGAGETALSMATGMAATPFAGLAGIGAELIPGGRTGAEAVEDVQRTFTYNPSSQTGQMMVGELGKAGAYIEQGVDWLATSASDNPLIQTTIKTAILGIPEAIGLKTGIANRMNVNKKVAEIERVAEELGVDMESPDLPDQIFRSADGRTVTVKGEGVSQLQNQLKEKRRTVKAAKDAEWEKARESRAALRPRSAEELEIDMDIALTKRGDFIIEDMPKVQRMMKDIEDIATRSAVGEEISVNDLFRTRKRINANRPAVTDKAQNAALSVMVKKMDDFIDDALFKDLIGGEAGAVKQWKDAIKAHKEYKMKFDDNKTIKKIIDNELTPEEVKNLVFGESKIKPGSATLIKRIKNILGSDHPSIDGLRQEMLLPIIKPLFGDKPNLQKFSSNVETLMRESPSVVKELTPESLRPILDLKKISDAAIKTGAAPGFELDLAEAMSRILFGHQIAKAALKVSLGTKVIKLLKGTGHSERKAMLSEMLGHSATEPFISKKSLMAGSIIADQIQGAIDEERQTKDPEIPSIPNFK